jgi:hypothetical protein
MSKDYFFDNNKPDDPNYPNFEPSDFNETNLIVDEGQYVINRDGDIEITTTANHNPSWNSFLVMINEGCFRTKYIGNKDDSIEYANQTRFATAKEIAIAKKYVQPHKVLFNSKGQGALL